MVAESSRILLADDEETFRRATARLLEQEGYHCDCAEDSTAAGELLTKDHDALISDIRMPGNMQFEFLRDVRERFPMLPIVLVTGYPSVQTAVESLRLSFTDYLLKPVDWPELREAVNVAVKKSRLLRVAGAIRKETDRVAASLDNLQEVVARTDSKEMAWPLEQYLAQSFAQMAILSSQVQSVLVDHAKGGRDQPVDVCRSLKCPRLSTYQQAVAGAVEVLERSKFAFRSKDLGILRKQLEDLLKEDAENIPRPVVSNESSSV